MTTTFDFRGDGSYANVFLNVGTKKDRDTATRRVSIPLMSEQELSSLYISDGFARRIIDLPAEEMVRAGYTVEGIEDDKGLYASLEDLQALEKVSDALRWSFLYGGALVVLLINDGGFLEDPLDLRRVKGGVEQLRVYDRFQVTRYKRYLDPNDRRFGQTELFQVAPIEGIPYLVHESRCLVFEGIAVPNRVRDQQEGWGVSKLEQCRDQLQRLGMSHYWGNQLLERAQQAIHGIPELTNLLRSPGGEDLVKKRVDLVDMTRSVNNTVVIDSEETYDLKSTPLSGVSDIIDRLGLALSAVTGIPEAMLFGRQQAGLNSTGQNELENWHAKIAQEQSSLLLPCLDRLVTVQLHGLGKYVDAYLLRFNPLTVPSKKDTAEIEFRCAQTYEILANLGALDPSEIRTLLAKDGYPIDPQLTIGEMDDLPQGEAVGD